MKISLSKVNINGIKNQVEATILQPQIGMGILLLVPLRDISKLPQ